MRLIVLATLGVSAVACGGNEAVPSNSANGAGASAAVGSVSDGALAGIMQATVAATSAMADVGVHRASNQNVRAFVAQLLLDSGNAQANLNALIAGTGVTPAGSSAAAQIDAASGAQVAALDALASTGFDEGFVESVDQAQSTNAATFSRQLLGVSPDAAINAFTTGMEKALEFEGGYANALEGNFDASAFLATQPKPTFAVVAGGAGGGGSGTSAPQTNGNGNGNSNGGNGTNAPTDNGAPGVGSGAGLGLGGAGTASGSGQDPGSGVGTGSGNGPGLGGSGTATGSGQDPGSGVGTGTSSTATNG